MMIDTESYNLYAEVILAMNRGLFHHYINPNLRGVAFEGDDKTRNVKFYFYHEGIVNSNITLYYDCAFVVASNDFDVDPMVNYDFEVIPSDPSRPLPKHEYWLYRRREPFVDPI